MSTQRHSETTAGDDRPWYCIDWLVDYYLRAAANEDSIDVLEQKKWKAIERSVVAIMVGGVALTAISEGSDPTYIATLTIPALVAIGGISVEEWLAAKRAMDEFRASQSESETDRIDE